MTSLITNILLLGLAYANLWFIISLITKRNDIADVAWGLGYVGLCVCLYVNGYRSDDVCPRDAFWGELIKIV